MRQLEHSEHRAAPHHGREVHLVLAGLKDPLNVGQAFRLASALGAHRLHLCDETPTPPSAKLNRTARGAQHSVVWESGALVDTLTSLKAAGVQVIGVEYATASVDIRELCLHKDKTPLAFVLGNEAHGLTPAVLASCDQVVHLPLYGAVSSLNVATALALALWEAIR